MLIYASLIFLIISKLYATFYLLLKLKVAGGITKHCFRKDTSPSIINDRNEVPHQLTQFAAVQRLPT